MVVILSGIQHSEGSAEERVEAVDIDTLFHQHSRYVASIAWRLLGRDSEVEDLVQDVFLDAVRGISKLRDPAATRGWLATLTVRAARRRIRRTKLRRLILGGEATDYSEMVDPSASPEHRLQISRCYEVLDAVPANHRMAWILRHVEGEPLATVAERCECSLATAKRYIERAQLKLREVLDHD